MNVLWTGSGWEDFLSWLDTDPKAVRRIRDLVEDARRHPFTGIGKPEALRGNLQGWWSRRITGQHRLVYRVTGADKARRLEIIQCRYHY
ncbi:MAG: Txe/YoeB family addiction module toxin [Thalassobaculum sp.]|uniref:Txe/YoeB family addiction module toxin n=1 Tax=Thalassobaculum sp. TaxID=2022740 RepID=UPI0032EF2C90